MLHTLIIWQSGFKYLSKLLWEVSSEFEVKYAEKIEWSPSEIHKNLTKIYPNRDFDERSPKVREIGGNELIMVMAVDLDQDIKDGVNLRVQNQKQGHRINGANYLHISDHEEESLYNFQALTNRSKDEFLSLKDAPCLTVIRALEGDTLVAFERPRFNTIEEALEVLNQHEPYLIQRNWEGLPETLTLTGHDDIDLLVRDYYRTLTLLNAQPVFGDQKRVHHLIKIGDGLVPLDVRFVGDGYYDSVWQEGMLRRRVFHNGFYVPDEKDHFWSLLYHAVFHKQKISAEYENRLKELGEVIPNFSGETLEGIEKSRDSLNQFLKQNRYRVPRPRDPSVRVVRNRWDRIRRSLNLRLRILQMAFLRKRRADLSRFTALKPLGKDLSQARIIKRNVFAVDEIIIKSCPKKRAFLLRNEKKVLEKLEASDVVPRVEGYIEDAENEYLILTRLPGKDLARRTYIGKADKEALRRGLDGIVTCLQSGNVIHRDIRPHNIMLEGGTVKLLDFQFAMVGGEQIQTTTPEERYVLSIVEKSLGDRWYRNALPLEEKDAHAVEQIKAEYCRPVGMIEMIRSLFRHSKTQLRRYAFYK
jgi:serine/threonine protein kinase